ncbi:UDP-glucuronosyltransferase [Rhyzopertha dominica]|nr:UDP-glucuronosyltransferase [Rhyzopertha dominica]
MLALAVLFVSVKIAFGARILAVMPTPSYSHQIVFRPLWRELSLRGHKITLLTTDPMNDKSYPNITEINWNFAYQLWNEKHQFTSKVHDYSSNFLQVADIYLAMMNDIMEQELSHPQVQQLIQDRNETFDLVMVEYIYPTMVAFSKRFDCPFIGVVPLDALGLAHEAIGNPTNPALYPDFTLPFTGDLTFLQRIASALYWVWIRYYSSMYIYPLENMTVKKHFGENMPHLKEIESEISMLFLNLNPVFHPIRPLVPATISIGGGAHLHSGKPLPKDLQEFLDKSTQGVIYFSLGTNIKSKDLLESTRKAILATFSELPYNILWKYETDNMELPKNVVVKQWLPQQDVLRHPNIKLFITQGGLQSMEEAITNGVPMLAMPFFSDQLPNVKSMVSKGLGQSMDFKKLTKEAFKEAILEVIRNDRYKETVEEYSRILTDQQLSGLELGVWWTEYVIRHKGAAHLRSPTADVPFYKYYYLDVLVFLSVVIYLVYSALLMLLRLVRRFIASIWWTHVKGSKSKND